MSVNNKIVLIVSIGVISTLILIYLLYISYQKVKNQKVKNKEDNTKKDLDLIKKAKEVALSLPKVKVERIEDKARKFEKAIERYNSPKKKTPKETNQTEEESDFQKEYLKLKKEWKVELESISKRREELLHKESRKK